MAFVPDCFTTCFTICCIFYFSVLRLGSRGSGGGADGHQHVPWRSWCLSLPRDCGLVDMGDPWPQHPPRRVLHHWRYRAGISESEFMASKFAVESTGHFQFSTSCWTYFQQILFFVHIYSKWIEFPATFSSKLVILISPRAKNTGGAGIQRLCYSDLPSVDGNKNQLDPCTMWCHLNVMSVGL